MAKNLNVHNNYILTMKQIVKLKLHVSHICYCSKCFPENVKWQAAQSNSEVIIMCQSPIFAVGQLAKYLMTNGSGRTWYVIK